MTALSQSNPLWQARQRARRQRQIRRCLLLVAVFVAFCWVLSTLSGVVLHRASATPEQAPVVERIFTQRAKIHTPGEADEMAEGFPEEGPEALPYVGEE